jgi:hypothetical protein
MSIEAVSGQRSAKSKAGDPIIESPFVFDFG